MFKSNDKLTLSLINATDIDGNFIPFSLKLPLENKEYQLPENIASIDLFEYQEGSNTHGTIVYHIYIGEKAIFKDIINEINNKKIAINKGLNIPSMDTPICYQIITTPFDEEKRIYAILNEQDIVLEDKEKLKIAIETISDEFKALCEQIKNIKTPTLKKSLTNPTKRIVSF